MTTTQHFIVTGYVRLPDGSPAAGARVTAHDQDMRSAQFLGEAVTDQYGAYAIAYTPEQFSRTAPTAARAHWQSRGKPMAEGIALSGRAIGIIWPPLQTPEKASPPWWSDRIKTAGLRCSLCLRKCRETSVS
jgi:hypothetical protein